MKEKLIWVCAALAVVLFAITPTMIFTYAPMEKTLFFNQKIFYYHVPSGFVQFASVFLCGIASIIYLKNRQGKWDDLAAASGSIGLVFSAMMLVTGSIWARVAWGYWWVWDGRLTTALLLTTVMAGYVLVRKFGGPSAERLAAGLGIFAMADVPLVYFSVSIWSGSGRQHPKTSAVPSLTGEMRLTFWLSVLTFMLFFAVLLVTRVQQARTERILHETREAALDGGLIE